MEYFRQSTYVPDGDNLLDRIKCAQYDATCNCSACRADREEETRLASLEAAYERGDIQGFW